MKVGIPTGRFQKNVDTATRLDPKELKLSEKSTAVVKEVGKIWWETGTHAAGNDQPG